MNSMHRWQITIGTGTEAKVLHEEYLRITFPEEYRAGHVLTENEAQALRAYFKIMIGNWIRSPAGSKELSEALEDSQPRQPLIDQRCAEYRFGEMKPKGGMSELELLVRKRAKEQALKEFPELIKEQKTFNEETWQENTQRVDVNKEKREQRRKGLREEPSFRDRCQDELDQLNALVDFVNEPTKGKRK